MIDPPKDKHDYTVESGQEASEPQGINEYLRFYTKGRYSISKSYTVKETASLRDYCIWVKDYTSPQLSFGSDILNAFVGVGNTLSADLDTRLLFGLPEKHLAECLWWTTLSGVTRPRGDIYSISNWSWASSLDGVYYDWHGDDRNEYFLKTASLVYFPYQDPEGGLRKLVVGERWIQNEISIQDISKLKELPALRGKQSIYLENGEPTGMEGIVRRTRGKLSSARH
ncbi:hypothetical protein F5Y06DRAFT_254417 [Hypoxylon sp. FL0890]|nr:hypothetical protein F5Y06DRAFT_254417 [Hypoxylon sp. FL0890]